MVGEREENVDDVLAIIGISLRNVLPTTTCLDGLHVKYQQIPQVKALWLKTPGKGAKCARLVDFQVCQ